MRGRAECHVDDADVGLVMPKNVQRNVQFSMIKFQMFKESATKVLLTPRAFGCPLEKCCYYYNNVSYTHEFATAHGLGLEKFKQGGTRCQTYN